MRKDWAWAGLMIAMLGMPACSSGSDKAGTDTDNDPGTVADSGVTAPTDDAGTGGEQPGGEQPGPAVDPDDVEIGDGTVPLEPGDPITAPDKTWQYVEVAGTQCRNGAVTGFGININAASDKLVIYMEGGGACFNFVTCATNQPSYGANNFGAGPNVPTLSRDAQNPFADWSFVYIPYCSGDTFTGTNPTGYNGEPQVGYNNVGKFLSRIVPTFKDKLKTVVLTGASAGGFGTAWNWLRVQDAFGDVPVHALDDSGPPMGTDYLTNCMQERTGKLWGWKDSVHPSCTGCDVDAGDVVRPLMDVALKRQKDKRFGLLSNDEDSTIKTFFAYGLDECKVFDAIGLPPTYPTGLFPKGLDDLRSHVAGFDNVEVFQVTGSSHVLLTSANSWNATVGSTSLLDWVTWFRDGDAKWVSVKP